MQKSTFFAALLGLSLVCLSAPAQQPAPADKGLPKDGPEVVQKGSNNSTQDQADDQNKTVETPAKSASPAPVEKLNQQITDLEKEIESLRRMLQKLGDPQKEVEKLQGKLAIVEGENAALSERVKTLENTNDKLSERVQRLEGINATLSEQIQDFTETEDARKQVTAKKPAFVKSAIEFYNYEGHPVKMNVNGVWHTLKEGKNTILVPYGPVQIHRYTTAEPRTFITWTPDQEGYVMEFDVGTP